METSFIISLLLAALAALFFARSLRLAKILREKQALYKEAALLIKNRSFSEAEDLLDGAGKEFSGDPGFNYLYGSVRHGQNRPAEALRFFLDAEKHGDPRARYSAGYMFFHNEEDPGAAMPRLEKAARRGFSRFPAGYTLGLLHYAMGNTRTAERVLLRTLSSGAENEAEIDNALGLISLKENDPAGAVLRFKASVQNDDSAADTCLNLSEAHAAKNEPAEELAMLERAESLHPQDKYLRLKLGEVLSLRGKYEEALVHLSAAVELDRAFSLAYFSRAKVFRKLGDEERYRSDCETALSCGRKKNRAAEDFYCATHDRRISNCACAACGRPLCVECAKRSFGKDYCGSCEHAERSKQRRRYSDKLVFFAEGRERQELRALAFRYAGLIALSLAGAAAILVKALH